jgi:hypothetical protein
MSCTTGNICAALKCSTDSDCTKFGTGTGCVNNSCTANICSSTVPCPPALQCVGGTCVSYSCENSRCPDGMACHRNTDGSKTCLVNPGLEREFQIILIGTIIIIILSVIIGILMSFDNLFSRGVHHIWDEVIHPSIIGL